MRVPGLVVRTICLVALAGGCERGSERVAQRAYAEQTTRGARGVDCARRGTDSARAVCAALQALDAADSGHLPQRLGSFARRGDTICVIAFAESANVLDGEGAVIVVRGRVRQVMLTDSAGCGPPGTATLPQHPLQF